MVIVNNKIVYPGTYFERCTVEIYCLQQLVASSDKESHIGIKGQCWLFNFIHMTLQVSLDYMHLCLEGTLKTKSNLCFLTQNKKSPCYLLPLSTGLIRVKEL